MGKVIRVFQDYVPAYRVPLFDALYQQLLSDGLLLEVIHGGQAAGKAQAARGDSAQIDRPWNRIVDSHQVGVGNRKLMLRHVPSSRSSLNVAPLRVLDKDAWLSVFKRAPLILWGHGKSYVSRSRWYDRVPELALISCAQHVFTYAPGGREYLLRVGVPESKVTAVGNAADGAELRRLVDLADETGQRSAAALGVEGRRVALSIGGLDASKRLDFLVEAARWAHHADERFLLVVCGSGELESKLAGVEWIRHVGRVDTAEKAQWSLVAESIWNPGRVGLVALDAVAMRLPLFTTRSALHAPEIELVAEGKDVRFLSSAPQDFALEALSASEHWVASDTTIPTPDDVAARMAAAIRTLVGTG